MIAVHQTAQTSNPPGSCYTDPTPPESTCSSIGCVIAGINVKPQKLPSSPSGADDTGPAPARVRPAGARRLSLRPLSSARWMSATFAAVMLGVAGCSASGVSQGSAVDQSAARFAFACRDSTEVQRRRSQLPTRR